MKNIILSISILLYSNISLSAPELPDPILTPGESYTIDADIACNAHTGNEPDTIRHVSTSDKQEIYKAYGLLGNHEGYCSELLAGCEIDHLISAKLGGTNSKKNLWPESYFGEWGAYKKDALEKRLIARVCRTSKKHPIKLPLIEAQHAIATNWKDAYYRFVIHNE
jgi:hypothetical protein